MRLDLPEREVQDADFATHRICTRTGPIDESGCQLGLTGPPVHGQCSESTNETGNDGVGHSPSAGVGHETCQAKAALEEKMAEGPFGFPAALHWGRELSNLSETVAYWIESGVCACGRGEWRR